MVASLALCGAATAALIATNASAAQSGDQSGRKPVMIALMTPGSLDKPTAAAPGDDGASTAPHQRIMRDLGARRAQICKDLYARKVGDMAFLETKLSLTASQAPLFARWKQASLDIAKQHQGDCEAPEHARGTRPSMVDRLTMEEDLLKKRLADIQAERPSLTALYNSLTPAQKEELGHNGMRRMAGRMHMMLGMMDGPRQNQNMGFMMRHDGPPNGPMNGPMGGPPEPPPPAQ